LKSQKVALKIYNTIVLDVERLLDNPNIGVIEPLLKNIDKYNFRYMVTFNGLFKIVYFR